MTYEMLGVAQYLEQHPVMKENARYKSAYLHVLTYITHKYSREDDWSMEVLRFFARKLLPDEAPEYTEQGLRDYVKEAAGLKFRRFKLFTYRYNLILDCCFINCMGDYAKAAQIKQELEQLFHRRYHKQIELLFRALFEGDPYPSRELIQHSLECWNANKPFISNKPLTLLITGNMSAGKSTFINALIGKKINRTQSEACTAKLHYIYNKPREDGLISKWDYTLELDADSNMLMVNHPNNSRKEIYAGAYFRSPYLSSLRLCLLDTPGVNSSLDAEHKQLTYSAVQEGAFDKLIYIINGENIGSSDDRSYLEHIRENVPTEKVIFVLNKLDRYKSGEDSIADTIRTLSQDLEGIGFTRPQVCPVSAYAGLLAKKGLYSEQMDEEEQDELSFFLRKFKQQEYDLSRYCPSTGASAEVPYPLSVASDKNKEKYTELLHRAGMVSLEKLISSK